MMPRKRVPVDKDLVFAAIRANGPVGRHKLAEIIFGGRCRRPKGLMLVIWALEKAGRIRKRSRAGYEVVTLANPSPFKGHQ